jgi:hypothetical protein
MRKFMPFIVPSSHQPTLATLGIQWLVLVVIMFGMIVSSIGMTSSHGVAVIAASHESMRPSAENAHGREHADEGIEFKMADESSAGGHPHHSMDHSHDTAHHLPLVWGAMSSQLPRWEVVVRLWIELGQAYRLDRPPMG